jgi:hypothetical protein
MLLQRLWLVTDCRPSFNCHIYRSATKGGGRGQLSHPLATKPQQSLLSSLYYSDDGNIKVKLYELELWTTSAERTWLPSVSVIWSFGKQYKCVTPYIQTYYATQSQNRYCPAKIGTSVIPTYIRCTQIHGTGCTVLNKGLLHHWLLNSVPLNMLTWVLLNYMQ